MLIALFLSNELVIVELRQFGYPLRVYKLFRLKRAYGIKSRLNGCVDHHSVPIHLRLNNQHTTFG